MDGAVKLGKGKAGRRWLAVVLCLVLLVTGAPIGAVGHPVQGDNAAIWLNDVGAQSSYPCDENRGAFAEPCCGAMAGCESAALPALTIITGARLRPGAVAGLSQAPPRGLFVAPLYHPPRLSSLT